MKWDKGVRKRITGKVCCHKNEKINGVVAFSSTYLVQVKFDNGNIKNYSYTQFLNEFEIIKPAKIEKKKKQPKVIKNFSTYANKVITDYLNKQYPSYLITLELFNKAIKKVYINNQFCGYLEVTDKGIKISYFIRMPNPLLAKYQIKWGGRPRLNLNYLFTDLSDKSDLYICLNELIFAHTQNADEFVAETREPTQVAVIK